MSPSSQLPPLPPLISHQQQFQSPHGIRGNFPPQFLHQHHPGMFLNNSQIPQIPPIPLQHHHPMHYMPPFQFQSMPISNYVIIIIIINNK